MEPYSNYDGAYYDHGMPVPVVPAHYSNYPAQENGYPPYEPNHYYSNNAYDGPENPSNYNGYGPSTYNNIEYRGYNNEESGCFGSGSSSHRHQIPPCVAPCCARSDSRPPPSSSRPSHTGHPSRISNPIDNHHHRRSNSIDTRDNHIHPAPGSERTERPHTLHSHLPIEPPHHEKTSRIESRNVFETEQAPRRARDDTFPSDPVVSYRRSSPEPRRATTVMEGFDKESYYQCEKESIRRIEPNRKEACFEYARDFLQKCVYNLRGNKYLFLQTNQICGRARFGPLNHNDHDFTTIQFSSPETAPPLVDMKIVDFLHFAWFLRDIATVTVYTIENKEMRVRMYEITSHYYTLLSRKIVQESMTKDMRWRTERRQFNIICEG